MPIFTSGMDLDLQEIPKPVPTLMKKTPRKKAIVVKDEDEEGEKVGKKWVDVEILQLIALKGEMEFDFAKKKEKKKKKVN